MAKIKSFFYKWFDIIDYDLRLLYYHIKVFSRLALKGKGAYIGFPSLINNPSNVYLHPYSRLQGHHVIINDTGKFIMKEYSGASLNLVVVTGNHTPTVGIPQFLLAPSHVNDSEKDIIVEEDVWIGTNVTLFSGAHLGRGTIVGANSLVNSDVPPYAVVVGSPARIIGVKFTIQQILAHEERLIPRRNVVRVNIWKNFLPTIINVRKCWAQICLLLNHRRLLWKRPSRY